MKILVPLALCVWVSVANAQLTYQMTPEQIRAYPNISNALHDALGMWNEQAELKLGILESVGEPDFKVVVTNIHTNPLNAPFGSLAVTVSRGHKGTIYVDISVEKERGSLYLENLMAHEIGHSIGLSHSNDSISIMYQYLYGDKTKLTREDIKRGRAALFRPETKQLTTRQ